MKLVRRRFLRLAAGAAALPAVSRIAHAQAYPSRPITAIVPFAAGGSGDTIARIMAEHMRKTLGQTIVVENIGGAAGSIGVGRVARAPADGYTIVFGNWPTHVLNGAIYNLPYHVQNDFEPIAMLATESIVIVGKKALPPNNLKELIAWLKANPGKASAGTTGAGGVGHVIGIFFQKETGTQFEFVPYRGLAPAMQDLIGGQIDIMFDTSANSLPQVRAGTVKVFGIASKARVASAPDVPTADEAGLPGFYASNWRGVWAPKGTPKDVLAKLTDAVMKALADAEVRKRFADLGQEIPPPEQQRPEALAPFHKAELDRWWPIMKAAKIQAK
jgi:tripartite-type tricarboxylate transporter receptor subunit TctC